MTDGGHFGWTDNVNYRTRPRYVKFEERSSNLSKVIALATKIYRGDSGGAAGP